MEGVIFSFGERSYVPPFTCVWPDRGGRGQGRGEGEEGYGEEPS